MADGDAGPDCSLPEPAPPPDLDYPAPTYFEGLEASLDQAGFGGPVVLLDMDRLDANIDAISSRISFPLQYRIVEKSLPSLDLLSYVSERAGTNRFMVLHLPFLSALLDEIPMAEVLVGKAHRTEAVSRFFLENAGRTDLAALASRVTFLADTPARLGELVSLAADIGVQLRIAVEVDVGLHRSGVQTPAELAAMLRVFLDEDVVRFAGLMGYDGQVAYTPSRTVDATWAAWEDATALYREFVGVVDRPEFRTLADRTELIFNSGGSSTFPMYERADSPVNDVAAGGGVLRPGGYPNQMISVLQPAIFIATPVLRRWPAPRLPLFTPDASARILSGRIGLTIQGGGWPAFFTHPPDIRPPPRPFADPEDINLVPNQGLVTAPVGTPLEADDWVFYHPRQSDALFQFEDILRVRGGVLESETMAPYPRRF